jgi:tRNA (guanine-N7-)-methyltransferase
MAPCQAAERTFTTLAEAPPDLLPVSWQAAAGRPLEIDVGCHKGRFLVEMASRYPTSNFLGIERQWQRAEKARRKISQLGLRNAAVVHGDSLETFRQLPDTCAACIHVLFPDPWPKRRHRARRLVRTQFLREISRILQCQGLLRLMTDDRDYMQAIEADAAALSAFRRLAENEREYPPSEFEIKFLSEARPLHRLLFKRIN